MGNLSFLKYRLRVAAKRAACLPLRTRAFGPASGAPSVTLFVSSLNTRFPLELTLRSMVKQTRYPNYSIVVGENASTDGSAEFLSAVARQLPLRVIASTAPKLHSEWLDDLARQVETKYWVAVDSDMLFLGRDWLSDLVRRMEADPSLHLLAAERNAPSRDYREPVSGALIDTGETPSTWLFCVRTSLREKVRSSFAFHKAPPSTPGGNVLCHDTGGRVLHEMRERGLAYAFMPRSFRWKYHHFGSMSWIASCSPPEAVRSLKAYQLSDIRRRLARIGAR